MSLQPASTPQQRAGQVLGRLAELFEIGREAGTNRPGLGEGEQRAHDLVAGWMREAGLEVEVDPAGNLIGRLPGGGSVAGRGLDAARTSTRRPTAAGSTARWAWWRRSMPPRRSAPGGAPHDRRRRLPAGGGLPVRPRRVRAAGRWWATSSRTRAICSTPTASPSREAFAALGLGRLPTRGLGSTRPRPASSRRTSSRARRWPRRARRSASSPRSRAWPASSSSSRAAAATPARCRWRCARTRSAPPPGSCVAAHEVARSHARRGRDHRPARSRSPGATNTIPGRAELFADLRAPDAAGLDALVERATARRRARRPTAGACTAEVAAALALRAGGDGSEPRPPPCAGRSPALGLEPVELPSGAGHDAAIMATAGRPERDAVRPQRRRRRQPRARGGHRRRRGRRAACRLLEAALRELAGMTDWEALARPSLRGLDALRPRPQPRRS